MDFTYFVAGFLGLAAGVVIATVLVIGKLGGAGRAFGVSFGVALLLDAILLINWSRTDSLPPVLLLIDFAIIAIFTAAGCAVGMWPPFAISQIVRTIRKPKV